MNPETLKLMKESAQQARNWNSTAATDFRRYCNPANVSALIAEYERLKEENDQLRAANLNVLIQEITERLMPEEAATFRNLILSATSDWVDEVTTKPRPAKRRLVN
jgi:hypothetical protein